MSSLHDPSTKLHEIGQRPLPHSGAAPGQTRASECAHPKRLQRPTQPDGLRHVTPAEYAMWDSLVDGSPQGTVFCTSLWLAELGDSVTILGLFNGGRLIAGIPLFFDRHFGIKACVMPKLIPALGVIMEPLGGKTVTVASRQMEILAIFAEYLANQRVFFQAFHPTLQNWLPFYWNGFRQTSRFTYVLDNLNSLDTVWAGMRDNIRREIRKAEKAGIAIVPCGARVVFQAISKTFIRQRKPIPYSLEYFERLYNAAHRMNSGQGFAAVDRAGNTHAAAFLVWDRKTAYYLAGGGDSTLRTSGATSLLMWHLIRFASSRSRRFDFEGSVIQPVERFFRSFGASQTSYNQIMKFPRLASAYLALTGKI